MDNHSKRSAKIILEAAEMAGGKRTLAKDMNVSESSIHCWISGKRKISIENSKKIQILTAGKIRVSQLRPDISDFFDNLN